MLVCLNMRRLRAIGGISWERLQGSGYANTEAYIKWDILKSILVKQIAMKRGIKAIKIIR